MTRLIQLMTLIILFLVALDSQQQREEAEAVARRKASEGDTPRLHRLEDVLSLYGEDDDATL